MEKEMYLSGMSLSDISKQTGIPKSTIRFRLKKLGVLRERREAIQLAGKNGRLGSGNRGKERKFTKEWCENISKSKIGKGKGYSIKPNGYVEITMGKNKGRLEHVVVIEESIGRRLYSNECVHHIDHDKTNNSIDNLMLMTRSEHAKLHAKENDKLRKRDIKGRYL